MGKKPFGICRLCGEYGKMSYEHIPPKSAFNDQHVVFQTMQDMLVGKSHSKFRQGIGKYSLCEKCNNSTGGYYGEAYASWARQGMEWLDKFGENPRFSVPFYIKPLNVVKQILVMTVAMSSEKTLFYHEELRRFLLNKEQRYLPPKYNVHIYFTRVGEPRFASDMVVVNVGKGGSYIEAEISLPPFGYCISKPVRGMNSLAAEQGLIDITWFARFEYNDWTRIWLSIPIRETVEPFPLDYRSQQEVDKHYQSTGIVKRERRKK